MIHTPIWVDHVRECVTQSQIEWISSEHPNGSPTILMSSQTPNFTQQKSIAMNGIRTIVKKFNGHI